MSNSVQIWRNETNCNRFCSVFVLGSFQVCLKNFFVLRGAMNNIVAKCFFGLFYSNIISFFLKNIFVRFVLFSTAPWGALRKKYFFASIYWAYLQHFMFVELKKYKSYKVDRIQLNGDFFGTCYTTACRCWRHPQLYAATLTVTWRGRVEVFMAVDGLKSKFSFYILWQGWGSQTTLDSIWETFSTIRALLMLLSIDHAEVNNRLNKTTNAVFTSYLTQCILQHFLNKNAVKLGTISHKIDERVWKYD